MASLRDIPAAVREVGLKELLRRIYQETSDDNLVTLASALAYAWLFAIFPFLIFLMSLLPYVPNTAKEPVQSQILTWIYDSLPWQAADTVWENVKDILSKPRASLMSVGLILTLWGASGGVNATISALDKCYDVGRSRPFYKQRPLAVVLTLALASLMLLLMLVLPVGAVVIGWIEQNSYALVSRPIVLLWKSIRYPASLVLLFSALHVLYHYGPSVRQKRSYISPGAVFCVAVWISLGLAFRFYLSHFGKFNETYGTVGGVAILLLFFYVDSLVLLIGAEINSEIDFIVRKVPRGSNDFSRDYGEQTN
jgi:membrane protein